MIAWKRRTYSCAIMPSNNPGWLGGGLWSTPCPRQAHLQGQPSSCLGLKPPRMGMGSLGNLSLCSTALLGKKFIWKSSALGASLCLTSRNTPVPWGEMGFFGQFVWYSGWLEKVAQHYSRNTIVPSDLDEWSFLVWLLFEFYRIFQGISK